MIILKLIKFYMMCFVFKSVFFLIEFYNLFIVFSICIIECYVFIFILVMWVCYMFFVMVIKNIVIGVSN